MSTQTERSTDAPLHESDGASAASANQRAAPRIVQRADGAATAPSHTQASLAIVEYVQSRSSAGLEGRAQKELARLLGLLPDLPPDPLLMRQARLVAEALLAGSETLDFAAAVRARLEKRSRTPAMFVVLGLLAFGAVVLYLPLLLAVGIRVPSTILGFETTLLGWVATAGATGSIVSILIRIPEYARLQNVNTLVLALTGATKPLVGTAFALFTFFFLQSGLVTTPVESARETAFYVALSFIAGFSERFAPDLAEVAVGRLGTGRRRQPSPPADPAVS